MVCRLLLCFMYTTVLFTGGCVEGSHNSSQNKPHKAVDGVDSDQNKNQEIFMGLFVLVPFVIPVN